MNPGKKLNILIADDEEGLRFSLASILEIEGYPVQTACDGLEALELVKNNAFDIAFFDIRMPGMNGVEVFKKIKQISPEMIVVMMTAYAMNDTIREAIKEGAFACISKPFEIEDVLNTVKEINSKKSGLIISHNSGIEDLLDDNLKSAGFISVIKSDFKSAADFIKRRKPEIIFAVEPVQNDYEIIKKTAEKMPDSIVVIISLSECKELKMLKNIKYMSIPINKNILSELLLYSGKQQTVIISGDPLWSNNLKIAVVAKGYEAVYYAAVESFLKEHDIEKCNFIICDACEIHDIDVFYGKVKEKNGFAKIIFVFDFESSVVDSLKKLNISFLYKPFDSHELFDIMEKS
ncbi:MAG: response regulator [Endomicrobium sp.]|jgi:DNA-binding NtrC family response regulator|nr:response regulator [Endomicrobium sp.]